MSTMKTAVVLAFALVLQAIGNVLLTRGMKATLAAVTARGRAVDSGISHVFDVASLAADNPEIWAGTAFLVLFFALCTVALSWADVSFVIPATAAGYVLNVAAGRYFLHEDVSPARWIGALVITVGVVLVSRSRAPGASVHDEESAEVSGQPSR